MTKEQLAELEEQAQWDDPTDDGGGADRTEWLLPTGALKRLLEERKRLRASLIEMVHDNRPGMGAEDRAREAIRFADEAAS